jgi:hypothetical protein
VIANSDDRGSGALEFCLGLVAWGSSSEINLVAANKGVMPALTVWHTKTFWHGIGPWNCDIWGGVRTRFINFFLYLWFM